MTGVSMVVSSTGYSVKAEMLFKVEVCVVLKYSHTLSVSLLFLIMQHF